MDFLDNAFGQYFGGPKPAAIAVPQQPQTVDLATLTSAFAGLVAPMTQAVLAMTATVDRLERRLEAVEQRPAIPEKRKPAAKRRLVMEQLVAWPSRTNHSIAVDLDVSDGLVATIRRELEDRGAIPRLTSRVGVDGRLFA